MLIKFISRGFHFLFWMIALHFDSGAQTIYPKTYFTSPLLIPLKLAGNFGEIRSNHFHSGLDFKTDSVEGKAVVAAADGYVSRIKVGAAGFGKALYITHPNGYVTVYGHLHHFSDRLNKYVEADQYRKESFETELFPEKDLFPVKQGEVIALSGNTGGSEGPHLHFEIRNEKTEKPINPLFFGLPVVDTVPPVLQEIIFKNQSNKEFADFSLPVNFNPNYTNESADTILLKNGYYAVEFKGYDLSGKEPNHLGIYKITCFADDSLIYAFKQTTFSFGEVRYVNAHINYPRKLQNGDLFERCYRLPGDLFSIYEDTSLQSVFMVEAGRPIQLTLSLEDFLQNKTIKKMIIQGMDSIQSMINFKNENTRQETKIFSKAEASETFSFSLKWNRKNKCKGNGFSIDFPEGSLYDDETLRARLTEPLKPAFKEEKQLVIDRITPLHLNATFTLYAKHFPWALRSKALIAYVTENHNFLSAGGEFHGDSITTKLKTFGTFCITADTVPPKIENYNLFTDRVFNKLILKVKITDNLSGIASYRATLDGIWFLMEMDDKTATLSHTFDDIDELANCKLEVTVTDRRGNTAISEEMIRETW